MTFDVLFVKKSTQKYCYMTQITVEKLHHEENSFLNF